MAERSIDELVVSTDVEHSSIAADKMVRFQALRTAYFAVDRDKSEEGSIVLNQIVTLKEDKGK